MLNNKVPECAKIWSFIYSLKGKFEEYADNIDDICAKDSLSDPKGLTVILPDENFLNEFRKNIHGDGNASVARRMLMNTICKSICLILNPSRIFLLPFHLGVV